MIAPPLSLPAAVAAVVARRREQLPIDGSAPVLDLGEPGAVELVRDAAGTAPLGPSYGTIVSAVAFPRFADAGMALRGLYRLLEPGGVLWLIEPVGHTGVLSRLRATLWSASRPTRQHHLERELPLVTRASGLTITDLERFSMPTRIWPLRHFIEARVRLYPPIGALPGDHLPVSESVR